MTKKTVERYMREAERTLQHAIDVQRRDLTLIYCLIAAGDLWHMFNKETTALFKTDHAQLIDLGYPATIEQHQIRYPELYTK